MNPYRSRNYFYFIGETIDDEPIYSEPDTLMTRLRAEFYAKQLLREAGGGHIDVFSCETDEFVFDVEV